MWWERPCASHSTPDTGHDTTHCGLNRRIQSTKPSGTTSSPSAQGGTRRIQEAAIRARGGGVCVIFVVRSPAPRFREGPWLLRAVSAEAGGCSRPRRYGGSPAHVGAAAAASRGGGGVARGRRETFSLLSLSLILYLIAVQLRVNEGVR
jgi:hypothetical protein